MCRRFSDLSEVDEFEPDMVINAATVKYTLDAFKSVLSHLPERCILSDIASVKTGLPEFYASCGHPFVSTHPMFGPTFASLSNLSNENAIIISEGDHLGKVFFKDLYSSLQPPYRGIHVQSARRDYSLLPVDSVCIDTCIRRLHEASGCPGTTFKRHKAIADGLMSEDDYLLSEILFNPNTSGQLEKIQQKLAELQDIVDKRDSEAMQTYLDKVRQNLK